MNFFNFGTFHLIFSDGGLPQVTENKTQIRGWGGALVPRARAGANMLSGLCVSLCPPVVTNRGFANSQEHSETTFQF